MSGKKHWGKWRRDGKEPPPVVDVGQKIPSKVWKRKYPCKKNKGDHSYAVALIKWADWSQKKDGTWEHARGIFFDMMNAELPYWVEWHCTACGKHAYEYRKLDKKFDKHRHTINEKEPS